MEIRPAGAALMHMDSQTDRTNVIFVFRDSAVVP